MKITQYIFNEPSVERFKNKEGENVERVSLEIGDHDVQILRFDGNNNSLLVKVDNHIEQLPLIEVNGFIRRNI